MIAGLNPYPAYKDSGMPWLGEVPAHWSLLPNRAMLRRRKILVGERYTDYKLLSLTKAGVIVRDVSTGRGKFSADMGTSQEVRCGDFVFCLFDVPETPRTVGLSPHEGMITGAYSVFECDDRMLARYLEAFYIAMDDRKLLSPLYSGLRNTIPASRFLGVKTPVPPRAEQTAIVRFLDHAARRIQRYIRAKQKLITLLEEQKQALIHQAVTGQIDVRTDQPYPAYKPSGVEWLGDVPAHWEVRCLKWVTRLQRGYDLPADQRVPGQFPVVSSGGFIGTHTESRCAGPGVVMGRYGSTDAVFYVEQDFWPHNTSLFVTHFQGNTEKWCYYLLRSITKADHAGKSAVPGLDRKDLFQIIVPVPPVDEQREVVRMIELATHNLDEALSAVQRQVALLHEYRTRLIADVVTGQIDVREAAAKLLEEDGGCSDDDDARVDQINAIPKEARA